ncbi:hypothetical protein WJX72_002734 [[Myrmecia] bisecta]|uniref:DNA mismatch repair proteins mutS family domain-containing protein n=1 Tax=[Myrmecia] bisecta TaxID=41462 RepID=A0AAW1QEJ3_9CHLO
MQMLVGDGESKAASSYKEVQSRFAWLEGKKVRDAQGRTASDPNYDARTVTVPPEVFAKLSESQKQYWSIKKNHRDVVLFFKVGTFYELYEDDAQIGQDVLNWKMTITGVGHCRQVGCPQAGVDEAVAKLTAAGYKVGRLEQMETAAEAKAKRGPKACIRRELMRIHTPATATGSITTPDAVHLLALREDTGTAEDGPSQSSRADFGFAFLDAAAGRFYVGQCADDAGRANLGAILTQVAPKELLYARGSLSATTMRLLAAPPVPLQLSAVVPISEFPEPADLGSQLQDEHARGQLFGDLRIPEAVLGTGDGALAALAALCLHLKRLRATSELATASQMVVPYDMYKSALRLDGPTLTNLELLEGSGGGLEGSLMACLDTCASPGGRRLLRQWLCRPLCSLPAIQQRMDAVEELAARPALGSPLRAALRRMTDLERALGKVRNATAAPVPGLPDWQLAGIQKRRLSALATAAAAVKDACSALSSLGSGGDDTENSGVQSAVLQEAVAAVPADSDLAMQLLTEIEGQIEWTTGANKAPKSKGKGPPVAALRDDAILRHLEQSHIQNPTNEQRQQAEIDLTTELVAAFNRHTEVWERLESALSAVDVLMAFAAFPEAASGPTCRPKLLPAGSGSGGRAVVDLRGLWHPAARAAPGTSVVPNDLTLGGREEHTARALLLTGPNMGGKSTLLRATCIAVVLAQVGCYVPASSCRLTLTDRIFTRLGAVDRLMAGESTFLVECAETASILRHATPDSLVVLDELGRGTSTFDGYAIAHAVLAHLSSQVDCRLLFATHYHPLVAEFSDSPNVALGHMAAVVSSMEEGCEAEEGDGLTFLYQLRPGACPRSYGLQVARLAGIPTAVVRVARQAGTLIEDKLQGAFGAVLAKPLSEDEHSVFKRLCVKLAHPEQLGSQDVQRKRALIYGSCSELVY